ncbi:AraC family transcriptional regulator [Paenibacillus sp. TAB 01]|uniref:AraC family transcriptional regulator n=1 Tax=Paenibacillus sp. TAB 01 TaxID=3368988 RepID=UPI0037502185
MPDFKYMLPIHQFDPYDDLKLYYCGSEQCLPGHSWGPALKDHYKIHYIHSGKGMYRTPEKTHTLTQGQGFLICPDVLSFYQADAHEPWTYSWVAFKGTNADSYLQRACLTSEQPVFRTAQQETIALCFQQMFQASLMPKSRDLRLLGSLYQFLSILIEDASPSRELEAYAEGADRQQLYVAKAVEFIETNYSRSMSIAELADQVGLERKYLTKLFKSRTGLSPQLYVIHYRIGKACEWLADPLLSVAEIAYSVGYKDPLLFSKMFKKMKGLSPSEYRRSLSASSASASLS